MMSIKQNNSRFSPRAHDLTQLSTRREFCLVDWTLNLTRKVVSYSHFISPILPPWTYLARCTPELDY